MELQWMHARYWFLDVEETHTDCNLFLPTTSIPDTITFFDAMGDILQSISDCNMISYDLTLPYLQHVDIYQPMRPLYEHAIFIAQSVDDSRYIIQIPAVTETILNSDSTIDQSNAIVVPFLDMLIDGDGTIAPAYDGNDFDRITAAYMQYRALSGGITAVG
jgi:hypothetical protein